MKPGVPILVAVLSSAFVPARQPAAPMPMNAIAEQYVKLVLAVGQHDADYVDSFFGPPEWQADARRIKRPLVDIDVDAASLMAAIPELADADRRDTLLVLRRDYLRRQL